MCLSVPLSSNPSAQPRHPSLAAGAHRPLLPPNLLLKLVAYAGLVGGCLVVALVHRSRVCVAACAAALAASAAIELYASPDLLPDAAKRLLAH